MGEKKQNGISVMIPAVKIPQPGGGWLVKPGVPVVLDHDQEIGTSEAAKMLGLSQKTVATQCDLGQFKTAYKPGGQPRSRWRIALGEVLQRREVGAG